VANRPLLARAFLDSKLSGPDTSSEMSEGAPTSLSVCVHDHVACVRVVGQAKFTSATDFKNLLLQLQKDGCTDIILDLTQCSLMDSTFLGVITAVARRFDAARKEGRPCTIKLYHPADRVLEALANLDMLRLFTVISDPPQTSAFQRVENGQTSRVEINRTCLEAHKALMNISEENERRFRDATEFFEKNLRDEERKG
jgi:anti-sigma B factor antagonist